MKYIYSSILATAMFVASATGVEAPVNLGTAGDFAILSKAGVSTTGVTDITGNIGVSPITSTAITGFDLTLDSSGTFSTSALVTGEIYAADYASPTSVNMTTAIGDMEIAYNDASGRTSGEAVTELGAGDISGRTLAPGLYKWGTGLAINSDITLDGPASGVWIFQIAENITVAPGAAVILSGGAQPSRIFWQVAGEANLGTTSDFSGVILSKTGIHLQTGATINGSLLAQTAVTLDAATVKRAAVTDAMEWFGDFDDSLVDAETGNGWLYHSEHGWLYRIVQQSGFWVWDNIQQDWLWTNESIYPYFYSANKVGWLFYQLGGNPNFRWFFIFDEQNASGGEWISAPAN